MFWLRFSSLISLFDGLKEENIFIINYSLIEYCEKKLLNCIDLGKQLNGKLSYWYDNVYTTKEGSKIISDIMVDDIVKIIKQKNLFPLKKYLNRL